MKTLSFKSDKASVAGALEKCAGIKPQIILFFAAPELFRDKAFIDSLAKAVDRGANVIGCSTAGEICREGVFDDGVSLLALRFDATEVRISQVHLPSPDQSEEAGMTLGKSFISFAPKGIFVLCPGTNAEGSQFTINGSRFAKGLADTVGKDVVVTGGLAGDGTSFKQTYTFLNGKVYKDHVVAFGLCGDKVSFRSGSRGGWQPFGPIRRVTCSEDNILYELDGKPALDLYKEYLGDKAADLPASGLLYPLSILDEDERKEIGLIRTILAVDEDKKSLTLAGDLPQGCLVRLMCADTDTLVGGAQEAAEQAKSPADGETATVLVSCIGRKIVMGNDVEDEVEAVVRTMGGKSGVIGFYSYGEICPFSQTGFAELHNQTMTITHISETEAA